MGSFKFIYQQRRKNRIKFRFFISKLVYNHFYKFPEAHRVPKKYAAGKQFQIYGFNLLLKLKYLF